MSDGTAAGTATTGTEGQAATDSTTTNTTAGTATDATASTAATTADNADAAATGEGATALAQRFPDFASWPPAAQQALLARDSEARRYQTEAGDQRIAAKTKAAQDGARNALAEAAKLAGLDIPGLTDTDKGEADPQALAAQITSTTAERDAARKESATVLAAVQAGVDPTKLDYLQFKLGRDKAYQGLTLDADDFGAKLNTTIASILAAEPTLKLTGAAAASGVESLGGSNGADEITPEQFSRMSVQERQDLFLTDKPTYDKLVAGAYSA